MGRFIQQFKIPVAIMAGFFVLGLMLKGGPYSQPETQPTQVSSSIVSEISPTQEKQGVELAIVTYVVDGDTVEIATGERVRLIGIDAAERDDPYYGESKDKLSELVLNKQVRMEKDVSNTDRYNRLLRYLYVGDTFVNSEMVRQGYATVFTYPPDVKYAEQFLEAQQEARSKQLGLWASAETSVETVVPQPDSNSGVTTSFTLPPCAQSDCDCGDFASHAHAQWFHENYNPLDKHRLDRDQDGVACESLP